MRKLKALIAGSTGYIGVQLIKLLVKHKYVNIRYLCGNNSVGKNISFYDKDLKINWGVRKPILSKKDRVAISFKDFKKNN